MSDCDDDYESGLQRASPQVDATRSVDFPELRSDCEQDSHTGPVRKHMSDAYLRTCPQPLKHQLHVPSACSSFCRRISESTTSKRWSEIARSTPYPHNVVSHGCMEANALRRQIIGRKLCTYNPQRMMNVSIRIMPYYGSTCVGLVFQNGSINVDGTRSIEETLKAKSVICQMIYDCGGTIADVSSIHLNNMVFNVVIPIDAPLGPIHKNNQDIVKRDSQFPGLRIVFHDTNVKLRLFPSGGPDGHKTMNAVLMGVRVPDDVESHIERTINLIRESLVEEKAEKDRLMTGATILPL